MKEDGRLLFDNTNDPYQLNPIYIGQGYDEVMDDLHETLVKHLENTNDPFLTYQWKTDNSTKYAYYDALPYAVTSEMITGTVDLSKPSQVKGLLYPNPAQKELRVKKDSVKALDLFDSAGHLLSSYGSVEAIDIRFLKKGIYFARIRTHTDEVVSVKIIK